jgi:hypothetical protein
MTCKGVVRFFAPPPPVALPALNFAGPGTLAI